MKTRILTALALLVVAGIAAAAPPDLPTPKASWAAMQQQIAALRKAGDVAKARAVQQNRPKDYLAKWEASGRVAEGEDRYYLGKFQQMARDHAAAIETFRACAGDETLSEEMRADAKLGFGQAAYNLVSTGALAGEPAESAAARIEASAGEIGGDRAYQRATLHTYAARCREHLGQKEAAIALYLRSAEEDPATAYSSARSVMGALMAGVHDLGAYEGLRERGEELMKVLLKAQQKHLAEARAGGDERAISRAGSSLERMQSMTAPLDMLGRPVPEWTVLEAYGDTRALEDLRGKVAVLDFWATWCGWCVRSFPAIRDLLRDYADRDLVLVGVTAPAGAVYDQNYALDEDLAAKAKEAPPRQSLRLPRDATPEQIADHRAKEREFVARFIANHEMTWDVVMIDPEEPAAKYALTGWPHAVVLDRAGRVRYFKRGALLRDRPEAVAAFREVLDSLLAEPEFTHVLVHDLDYYGMSPAQKRPPDGRMLAGTKVVILREAGSYVRVRAEDGTEGFVEADCVKPLER